MRHSKLKNKMAFVKLLFALDALILIGYGGYSFFHPETVVENILTKIPADAIPFASVMAKLAG